MTFIAQIQNSVLIPPAASVAPGVEPIDAAIALGWQEPGLVHTITVPGEIMTDPETGELIIDPNTGLPKREPSHEEEVQDQPIPNGKWREITQQEKEQLQKPSLSESINILKAATNERLSDFVKERGYDNIMSATSYGCSTNEVYLAEGQYAIQARDETWSVGNGIINEVLAGTRPLPSVEDYLRALPTLAWPTT